MSLFFTFMRWLTLASLMFSLSGPSNPVIPNTPPDQPYHAFVPRVGLQDTYSQLGPTGGEITDLVIDPQDSQVVYAGTFGGGVYKSLDGGKTWQDSSAGLIDLYIQSLVVDPQNPNTLYAGMYKYGVYKSVDGGATWASTGPGFTPYPIVYALAVDPRNPQVLYAGTRGWTPVFTWQPPWGGGVFKSVNGGATWTKQNNGLTEDWVYSLAIDPSNTQIVYAASHSQGVFKSTNGAASWTAMNFGVGDLAGRAIVINPQNPKVVYFGAWHTGGVYKTTDGGSHWSQVSSGLNSAKIYRLLIDPTNPAILYACSYLAGLYQSTNSASGWTQVALKSDFIPAVAVDPANHARVLLGTAGAGIYLSTNSGNSWAASNLGLRASLVDSLAQNSSTLFVGLDSGGLYRSTDGGTTWQAAGDLGHNSIKSITINPSNSAVIYATTILNGVFKTTDGGATWQTKNSGLAVASALEPSSVPLAPPSGPLNLNQAVEQEEGAGDGLAPESISYSILTLAFDVHNPATVFIGTSTSGVLQSTNSGGSWAASGLAGKAVYSLAVDPVNSQVIYAATDGSSNGLFKSDSGGSSWSQSNSGLGSSTVYFVLVDPANHSHVLAGTSDGVYQSTNSGGNWTRDGLPGNPVYSLSITGLGLAAATGGGLFVSRDGGSTWLDFTGIAPVFQVNCILPVNSGSRVLFAGTNGRSLAAFPGNPSQ